MKNADKARQAVDSLASTPTDHDFNSWNHLVGTLEVVGLDQTSAYKLRLAILRFVGANRKAQEVEDS